MNEEKIKVFVDPLISTDNYLGTEIELTAYLFEDGVSEITEFIDSEDNDFGIFSFGELDLAFDNTNGIVNSGHDYRSVFPGTRNLGKIRIVYIEEDPSDGTTTETTLFHGLINEEATRTDIENDTVTMKVLSRDSIFRVAKVDAGKISAGDTADLAIRTALNQERITNVLNFSAGNINVGQDFILDVGSFFNDLPVKDVLSNLLLTTNSVLILNDAGDIIVKERIVNAVSSLDLFGKFDLQGRENIISLFDFNDGLQRLFTSIFVNGTIERSAPGIQGDFGVRQKTISADYITSSDKMATVANALLNEFKNPKLEVQVIVPISIAKDVDILDPVSVNYPFELVPEPGKFLPYYAHQDYSDEDYPYSKELGSFEIDSDVKFKVIEIKHNPSEFISTLKLRQSGTTLSDGYFSAP